MTRYLGIDLAWSDGTASKLARESGLAVLESDGTVLDAGWAIGRDAVLEWLDAMARPGDIVAIDAPLVVNNVGGMRDCEREVAQRYMSPWKVGANASNLAKKDLAGVALRRQLEDRGYVYADGTVPADRSVVTMIECYPYTTIVGTEHLGYDERPRYKRKPKGIRTADWSLLRAAECDELIRRISTLRAQSPGVDLDSHPVTRELLRTPSPLVAAAYKHREDLLDAVLCAWTAALWHQAPDSVQVLGRDSAPDAGGRRATIVAPAKATQLRLLSAPV